MMDVEIFLLPKEGAEEENVPVPNLCVARATTGLWVEAFSSSRADIAAPFLLAYTAPRFPKY